MRVLRFTILCSFRALPFGLHEIICHLRASSIKHGKPVAFSVTLAAEDGFFIRFFLAAFQGESPTFFIAVSQFVFLGLSIAYLCCMAAVEAFRGGHLLPFEMSNQITTYPAGGLEEDPSSHRGGGFALCSSTRMSSQGRGCLRFFCETASVTEGAVSVRTYFAQLQ